MLCRPTQRTLCLLAPLMKQPTQFLKTASVSTGAFYFNLTPSMLKPPVAQSLFSPVINITIN